MLLIRRQTILKKCLWRISRISSYISHRCWTSFLMRIHTFKAFFWTSMEHFVNLSTIWIFQYILNQIPSYWAILIIILQWKCLTYRTAKLCKNTCRIDSWRRNCQVSFSKGCYNFNSLKGIWEWLFLCTLTSDGYKCFVLIFADPKVNTLSHFLINQVSFPVYWSFIMIFKWMNSANFLIRLPSS